MWGRLVLGMLVFAWASASAQPCLMAMDMNTESALVAEHTAHGGHHAADTPVETVHDCDHCPPGGHQDDVACGSGLNADCGAIPEVSADSRNATQKLKDAPVVLVFPAPPPALPSIRAIPPPAPASHGQLKYRAGPSISVRHCVFLK